MLISGINISFNCKVSWTPIYEIEFHHRDGDSRSRLLRNSYSTRVDRGGKKKKEEGRREKKGAGRFVTSRKGIRRDS